MINAPVFTANELNPSSLPLSSWIQHGQAYAQQQQYEQSSSGIPGSQQAQVRPRALMPPSTSPALQARKPIWMTSAAVIDSLPLGSQDIPTKSISPISTMSPPPPPPTSTGSPVVNAAMINAAAAHLAASARNGPTFSDNSPFASPHTPLDAFFRPATTIASTESMSTIGTPNSASLFNPFEQRYITDFLNKFTFDSHELKNDSSLSRSSSTQKHSVSSGNNRNDNDAYPSPEPNRPENSLKLLASHSIARANSSSSASPNINTSHSIGNVKSARSSVKRKRKNVDETEQRKRSLVATSIRYDNKTSINDNVTDSAGNQIKKELLTEEQKRLNHIRSEQKRRDAIRTGFQDLGEMVPALRGARYSKSVMLDETVAWIAKLEADCQKMQNDINLLEARCIRQQPS
ncbi:hypothetical protein BDF22DRAFT_741617 [Syncephalis plumigaleata]|nr:hypothetical protein BDF22DRAFT_741617 [Syncephalis plumigaleata]